MRVFILLSLFFANTSFAVTPDALIFTWKGRGAEQAIELANGKITTTSWQHKTESFQANQCHKKTAAALSMLSIPGIQFRH